VIRINAGCGDDYRGGYVNVDLLNAAVADRLMPLWDMDFPDSSATEILALQAIEHLGFFRAKHFIAESYRILAPGGRLVMETPDIETAFSLFAAGGRTAREELAQWIFGTENPGMNHIFCFPRELLEETLADAGFTLESAEKFRQRPQQPTLRLTAVKKCSERNFEIISRLRKNLVRGAILPGNSEPENAQVEIMLGSFRRALSGFFATKKTYVLENCLDLAFENASVTRAFFLTLEDEKLLPDGKLSACAALLSADKVRREIASRILNHPLEPQEQDAAFATARALCKTITAGILNGAKPNDFLSPEAETPEGLNCAFITPRLFEIRSVEFFRRGARELALKNRRAAEKFFTLSLRMSRVNPPAWRARAELAALAGDAARAAEYTFRAEKARAINPGVGETPAGMLQKTGEKGITK